MAKATAARFRIMALFTVTMLSAQSATAQEKAKLPDYRPVPNWPKVPTDVKLGPVSAVATDASDRVFVLHRGKQPVLIFERDGAFVRSWGDEHLKTPHGLRIDREGNVWITDVGYHQVLKFNADGKLLLALGKKGQAGANLEHFDRPTDVAVTPLGAFYVSDGYGNTRVLRYAKDGKLEKQWGTKGTGPGQFNLPHSVVLDAGGKVYVADRENNRIQVFDGDGNFIAQWNEGGAPYGLFLTQAGHMFIADGVNNWIKVLDSAGKTVGRFSESGNGPGQLLLPHMLCVDSQGAVYVAEVNGQRVQKFVAK